MSFLKVHHIKVEEEFVERGEIHISDKDIQKLNRKIRETVQKNNDEQTRAIDELGLLDKKYK